MISQFIHWQLILFAALQFSLISAEARSVLVIIADDLGRDSLASYNSNPFASLPPTPTLDTLAENGILFNRAYSYASCSPTRASILTGRYAFRSGVVSPGDTLQLNEFTLPEAILASGQIGNRLAHLGKWHLGGTADSPRTNGGWPHFSGSLGGGVANYSRWSKIVNGVTTDNYTVYATTDLVNEATNWITDQGANDWFLWVAFNAPHTPFHKPDNELHDYDTLDGSDSDIANNPRLYYEAMVQAMDTEIARLLEAVDLTTTTVIFLSDNGSPAEVVQSPFSRRHAKGSLYEGGINVPMIIAGDAIPENLKDTTSHAIVQTVDLYQTILDLLKIDVSSLLPGGLVYDSESFYPVLTGASTTHRDFAYVSRLATDGVSTDFTIISDLYKWMPFGDGSEEFYARSDGLSEDNDLMLGTLNSTEQAALASFQAEEDSFQNEVTIKSTYFGGNQQLILEVGWFANATFTVEASTNLAPDSWQETTDYTLTDNGGQMYLLNISTGQADKGFYRISAD